MNKLFTLSATTSLCAAITVFCSTQPARAEIAFTPSVSGEVVVEWQDENTYNSDDASNELNNMFGRVEIAPTVTLTENLFVDGVIVTEPMDQAATKDAGDDRAFKSEGTFFEELKLNFEQGPVAVWAGKFNPGFGSAWDYGRGIWSEDFAEDYEITEKVGVGASYAHEQEGFGTHTLSGSSFFNDTTSLSRSTITARDKARKEDGGAGNTEDLSSFAASLDGENIIGVENLSYNLSFRHLAQGDVDTGDGFDDEQGFAANVKYAFPVTSDIKEDLLLEYAGIDNFGGIKDTNKDYYTASLISTYQDAWNLTLAYTKRDIDETGTDSDYDDHLFQATVGYDFGNGFTAETGYKGTEEANVSSDVMGFLVRYTREF